MSERWARDAAITVFVGGHAHSAAVCELSLRCEVLSRRVRVAGTACSVSLAPAFSTAGAGGESMSGGSRRVRLDCGL